MHLNKSGSHINLHLDIPFLEIFVFILLLGNQPLLVLDLFLNEFDLVEQVVSLNAGLVLNVDARVSMEGEVLQHVKLLVEHLSLKALLFTLLSKVARLVLISIRTL